MTRRKLSSLRFRGKHARRLKLKSELRSVRKLKKILSREKRKSNFYVVK